MGLPEIVDFARNFAVMVRVQGPVSPGLFSFNLLFELFVLRENTGELAELEFQC